MDKIARKRDEGLLAKLIENEMMDCRAKILVNVTTRKESVENELKGSRRKGDTANEDVERRIATTWCGSKVADWRMAAVKTFASLAVMASMAPLASMASMASMVWMAQGGTDVEVP